MEKEKEYWFCYYAGLMVSGGDLNEIASFYPADYEKTTKKEWRRILNSLGYKELAKNCKEECCFPEFKQSVLHGYCRRIDNPDE